MTQVSLPIASKISASAVPRDTGGRSGSTARDLLLAIALAVFLSATWAMRSWADLSALILPDYDDMMRLMQVRDWIAGQGINDWTQYRMAPPRGSPMHWSRVNDVVPAGLILTFTPLVGRHAAEVIAVLAYPAMLFTLHLWLSARIARKIWGERAAPIAIVLAALAYPGTTVFAPGRIDHHALQVVLIDVAILAILARASVRSGLASGAAIAVALVVGLETVPQLAAVLAVIFVFWIVWGEWERARLAGVALGLAATTLPFVLFLRPTLWTTALCDAFTPASSNATFAGAATLGILALITPRLHDWRWRLGAGAVLGGVTLLGLVLAYPVCLTGPYGQVDPFLRREFIAHIDEANSIFLQKSLGRGIQLGGLMLAALAGAMWVAWRRPQSWRRWAPSAAVVAISALVTLAQVRGTYLGTPLSAPLLAGIVLAARDRQPPSAALRVLAWLGLSGMGWYAAPMVIERALTDVPGAKPFLTPVREPDNCMTRATWPSIDRYPPGVVMAPVSVAAYLTGMTHMSTVGAGYHRNNAGNMALYRFFLSPPDQARPIARAWGVRYVVFCPTDFTEMDAAHRYPNSLAAMLSRGQAPRDFQPLPLQGTRLRLYRLP